MKKKQNIMTGAIYSFMVDCPGKAGKNGKKNRSRQRHNQKENNYAKWQAVHLLGSQVHGRH